MPDILGGLRAHPIRVAALVGGAVGFANAMGTEAGAILHRNRNGAVLMFWPYTHYGTGVMRAHLALTLFILSVEIAANVLVYALMVAAPVAGVVGLWRLLRRSRSAPEGS
jgi:hypothetical protein